MLRTPAISIRCARALLLCACIMACAIMAGCQQAQEAVDGAASTLQGATTQESVEGDPMPSVGLAQVSFNSNKATSANNAAVDTSNAANGYVAAKGKSKKKLKLVLTKDAQTYNYSIENDGTVAYAPLNMGNGSYTVRVMENTSGNKYVALVETEVQVELEDETLPYILPNVYCNFNAQSTCVAKAKELADQSSNQADFVSKVFDFVVENINYDNDKAKELASVTDYIPNPDETLQEGKGICFDYASLCAAMLRSQGIPCKIITGNVSPSNIYHAWNMVYISGTWVSASINVQKNKWSLIDTTFAATGGNSNVGDGSEYTDRFTY